MFYKVFYECRCTTTSWRYGTYFVSVNRHVRATLHELSLLHLSGCLCLLFLRIFFHAIMLFRPFPQLLFIIVDDVFEYSCEQKQLPRGCFVKMVFLKILQNLQENTCARVSFSIKNTFSYRTSLVTASVWNKIHWKWDVFFRDAYNCE